MMEKNSWSKSLFVKLLQNHLEVDICQDLIVEHEGEALFDSGLGGQLVIEQTYLNNCLLLYNNLKMDYFKGWVVPNDGIILRRVPVHLEVDICEDLIVEHEGEALLDSGCWWPPNYTTCLP